VEQQFTLRRSGVDLLGERAERDATLFEAGDRCQQMRQRSAEPVELPNDQTVARPNEGERLAQPGPIIAAAARAILEDMPLIDPRREQCIALQIQHLTVTVGRDPHVANQHAENLLVGVSAQCPIPTGFVVWFPGGKQGNFRPLGRATEIR
jgi:hypothetical protein